MHEHNTDLPLPPTLVFEQLVEAYYKLALGATYRPMAPSDGFGNITVDLPKIGPELKEEAVQYAKNFWKEEDDQAWELGCCDFETRPAAVFAIEAVRLLNSGVDGRSRAVQLLELALRDAKKQVRKAAVKNG